MPPLARLMIWSRQWRHGEGSQVVARHMPALSGIIKPR